MMQMINNSQLPDNTHQYSARNLGQSNIVPMTIEKDNKPSSLGNNASIYVGKVKT
jgi:hypothetical protein